MTQEQPQSNDDRSQILEQLKNGKCGFHFLQDSPSQLHIPETIVEKIEPTLPETSETGGQVANPFNASLRSIKELHRRLYNGSDPLELDKVGPGEYVMKFPNGTTLGQVQPIIDALESFSPGK